MFFITGVIFSDLSNDNFDIMADTYVPFDDGNVNHHLLLYELIQCTMTNVLMNSSHIDVVQRHGLQNE